MRDFAKNRAPRAGDLLDVGTRDEVRIAARRLLRLAERISPTHKKIVRLRFLGWQNNQIAARLGIHESGVSQRIADLRVMAKRR